MSVEVAFEPVSRRTTCAAGETVLEAARRCGVMLNAVCGGQGICGRCVVRVITGLVSEPTGSEHSKLNSDQLPAGSRLACQATIASDLRVQVPYESLLTEQRIQAEGESIVPVLDPAVRVIDVSLSPPTLKDTRSDAARLREAIGGDAVFPISVMQGVSHDLRHCDFRASVFLRGRSVVSVRPMGTSALGLAVDIGTTKLAAYLVDLASGATLAMTGAINPQTAFGDDVMTRIGHVIKNPDGAEQLRTVVCGAVNQLAHDLCGRIHRTAKDIVDAVVVGNTAMHHLFLGLPVKQLGLAPYLAAESAPLDVPAGDLGLDFAPGAYVYMPPNIAGFVGADHVAMLLATGVLGRKGGVLAMDIGTNTEVSLMASGRHWSCSVASGPAFEGGHIRFGMRAAPGAIESIVLRDQQIIFKTVADSPPIGLCGSGILDLVAQLLCAGIMDSRGALADGQGSSRVRLGPQGPEFVVVAGAEDGGREISFSRSDISEIQLAKGAIRGAIDVLLQRASLNEADIEEVIIAGAFGTYLNVQSAIDIGMFPRLDGRRFRQVGNAAGTGARMVLLSKAERDRAARIARQVEYVELTASSDFASHFARGMLFQ